MKDKDRKVLFISRKGKLPMNAQHINRNDPCKCGSGKKAKNCCGCETIYGVRKANFE